MLEGLRPLEREGLIAPWTDRLIEVGDDWQAAIQTALSDCDLALFLLSSSFLASDFIDAQELEPLLRRAEQDGVRLVPILLSACDWTNSILSKRNLQPLPGWDRYIEAAQDRFERDKARLRVIQKIRKWAEAAHSCARKPALLAARSAARRYSARSLTVDEMNTRGVWCALSAAMPRPRKGPLTESIQTHANRNCDARTGREPTQGGDST